MMFLNKFTVSAISFYQKRISVLLPSVCRFSPTCSSYAKDAFIRYAYHKALYLSIKRLLKCHPFHPGGYDPVP